MASKLTIKGKLAMKSKLTTWILIAMLAGIGVGWMCHDLLPTPESAKTVRRFARMPASVSCSRQLSSSGCSRVRSTGC